ncbi:helix-turn-helix domain-containing protein [Enterococcus gallinarum]|uniref:helix-turn-helix domain-containing protein n=1 Tax=Enterococcus gallinarum TaxID=1353 RepID=UPI002064DF44|nr:MAG TPA: helix-turn-helix domain protein [Caudoviricetes sp.]
MSKTEPDKNEVGIRIRTLRNKHGLTLEEFGLIFDPPASKSIVSRWESGKSLPSSARIKVIAEKFHVSTLYLLYGRKTFDDIPDDDVFSTMLSEQLPKNERAKYKEIYMNSLEENIMNVLNDLNLKDLNANQIYYLSEALTPIEDSYSEVPLRLMHGLLNSINRLIYGDYSVTTEENGMIISKQDKEAIQQDVLLWASRIVEHL